MITIEAGVELDMAVCEAVGVDRISSEGCFLPSTDLNAAFAAAERVGLFLELNHLNPTYWIASGKVLGDGFGAGETAALAICEAILELKDIESRD